MICTSHLLMASSHLQSMLLALRSSHRGASKQQWLVGTKEANRGLKVLLSDRVLTQSTTSFPDSLCVMEAATVFTVPGHTLDWQPPD